jgi:hypothetical protein
MDSRAIRRCDTDVQLARHIAAFCVEHPNTWQRGSGRGRLGTLAKPLKRLRGVGNASERPEELGSDFARFLRDRSIFRYLRMILTPVSNSPLYEVLVGPFTKSKGGKEFTGPPSRLALEVWIALEPGLCML